MIDPRLKLYVVARKNPKRHEIARIVILAIDEKTAREEAKEKASGPHEIGNYAHEFNDPVKSFVQEIPFRNREVVCMKRY